MIARYEAVVLVEHQGEISLDGLQDVFNRLNDGEYYLELATPGYGSTHIALIVRQKK